MNPNNKGNMRKTRNVGSISLYVGRAYKSKKNSKGFTAFGLFSLTGTESFGFILFVWMNILPLLTLFKCFVVSLRSFVGTHPWIINAFFVSANLRGASAFSNPSIKNSSTKIR